MALPAASGARCSFAQAGPGVSDLLADAPRTGVVPGSGACLEEASLKMRWW